MDGRLERRHPNPYNIYAKKPTRSCIGRFAVHQQVGQSQNVRYYSCRPLEPSVQVPHYVEMLPFVTCGIYSQIRFAYSQFQLEDRLQRDNYFKT
jgi:hypothetical protein